jgi:putative oxidoreductase
MQIAKHIPAYLLSLVFIVFGATYFLHFIEVPPMTGDPAEYMKFMDGTGYMKVVKALEVIIGVLLAIPKTRALGLVLIAPIVVNIFLFEACISKGMGIGLVLVLVNALGLYLNREKYQSIFS